MLYGRKMKDTFLKLGKDTLNNAKNETVKQVSTSVENKKSTNENFVEKFMKKATGAGDLLEFKNLQESNNIIQNLLLDNEQVFFFLESVVEAIVFTNKAIIHSKKSSMASSKSLTSRYELKSSIITNVKLETAGTIDRDAEIKFNLNEEELSWDILKTQMNDIIKLYSSLVKISNAQHTHAIKVNNLQTALTAASTSVNISSEKSKVEDFEAIVNFAEKKLN